MKKIIFLLTLFSVSSCWGGIWLHSNDGSIKPSSGSSMHAGSKLSYDVVFNPRGSANARLKLLDGNGYINARFSGHCDDGSQFNFDTMVHFSDSESQKYLPIPPTATRCIASVFISGSNKIRGEMEVTTGGGKYRTYVAEIQPENTSAQWITPSLQIVPDVLTLTGAVGSNLSGSFRVGATNAANLRLTVTTNQPGVTIRTPSGFTKTLPHEFGYPFTLGEGTNINGEYTVFVSGADYTAGTHTINLRLTLEYM